MLGVLTTLGIYALGCRLFDRRTGLLAAAFVAFYPGAIGTSVFILSEAAFCPLLIAQLFVTTLAGETPAPKPGSRSLLQPVAARRGDARSAQLVALHSLRHGDRSRFSAACEAAFAMRDLFARRPGDGHGSLVGTQRTYHRPFRAYHAASRRQPVRRLESACHGRERNVVRARVRGTRTARARG